MTASGWFGRYRALVCLRLLRAVALVVLGGVQPASKAQAQSVDYGSFDGLFGEPVTNAATGQPQRVSEVPADMDIITQDDIRRSGADNLPDILQFVAGLDVRRYGFAAADVGVRGYNETSNPRLLVLLNGQQVYLDDLGRTQWYTLPVQLAEIRQIEVVKGPNTALFGFNAVSGVINIVTYDPLQDSVNTVTARAGTQEYRSGGAVATLHDGSDRGLRVAVDGFRAREFDGTNVAPGDIPFRDSPKRDAVSLDGRAVLAPEVEAYASAAIVNTRIWEATSSPYFGTDFQRTNWSRVGVSAYTAAGLLNIDAYRNELRYAYLGSVEHVNLQDAVYVLQASDVLKIGSSHVLRAGLDYRMNNAVSSNSLAGHVGYAVVSASLMWAWQVTPAFSVTNAVRVDYFTLSQRGALLAGTGLSPSDYNRRAFTEASFNSGVVWRITPLDTLRLLAARGLQLPSVYDLGLQDHQVYGGQTYVFDGRPNVTAASVLNLELDWDRSLPAIKSTLRVAAFAQRTDNILSNPYEATPVPNGRIVGGFPELLLPAANVGHSSAVGGEIGLRGKLASGLRWSGSYALISTSDHLSINPLDSPQSYQQGTPRHALILQVGDTLGRWEWDVQGRWQSGYIDYGANPVTQTLAPVNVGSFVTLNARVGYEITSRATLSVSASQFNNSHLLQAAAPPVERRVFTTVTLRLD
jgi:outer membrane receptor for ferrienterochelin and colicins